MRKLKLTNPVYFNFGSNWKIEVAVTERTKNENLPSSSLNHAALDFDCVGGFPIYLSSAKRGDRFKPLGLVNGSLKLSDFFINSKLPKSARNRWPILKNHENEIIWIPCFRPAQPVRLSDETKKILNLKIKRV